MCLLVFTLITDGALCYRGDTGGTSRWVPNVGRMARTLDCNASGRRSWGALAAVVLLAIVIAAAACVPLGLAQTARAANVSYPLYGVTLLGWSKSPGTESNPGPLLTATEGDVVEITLTSEDGLEHVLFIDYNKNGAIGPSDYKSPTTTGTITFNFTATVAGIFTYYSPTDPPFNPDLSLMRGTWETRPGNSPPSASIASPDGGASWTGGTAHDIVFSASDPEGDPMQATLSYTYNGGAAGGPIAGPFPPGMNPNTRSWTPSGFSATDTIVRLRVDDSHGGSIVVTSSPFEVDSNPPTLVDLSPSAGATLVGINAVVTVTWSEAMYEPASGGPDAFSLRVSGGAWVRGSVRWSIDAKQMTFDPGAMLSPGTRYEARVNSTARDHSDPGNTFAGPGVWNFTTSSSSDLTPPTILAVYVDPPIQVPDAIVNLSADAQDSGGIGTVSARVSGPSFDANITMAHASGTRWVVDWSYSHMGHYDAVVWATDASGNAASRGTSFEVQSGPPGPRPNLPPPADVLARALEGGNVQVTWTPVDGIGLSGYNVYRGNGSSGQFVRITSTPVGVSATPAFEDRAIQGGQRYYYAVTSVNASGAESAYSKATRVYIPLYQESPLFDPVPWAVAGTAIGVMTGAIYGVVWRRRPLFSKGT